MANLAIGGETASSFTTNAGRTPPVMGRGDAPSQLEHLNYGNSTAASQSVLFASAAAQQRALGNTIQAVTVTLGFNELAALAPMQATTAAAVAQPPAALDAYQANYAGVLDQVRGLAPEADPYLLGYYNPFPADPASPAAPIFNTGGTQPNGVIQGLAAQFGATCVDTATPFLGNEARLTCQAHLPGGAAGRFERRGRVRRRAARRPCRNRPRWPCWAPPPWRSARCAAGSGRLESQPAPPALSRLAQDLAGVPVGTLRIDFVAPVRPLVREAHAGQALQARAVLEAGRTPGRAAQRQPVQRGAATGFQVRLVPHRP